MRYLLDTNVVSDLVRNPQGQVTQRIRDVGEALICTSIVVAAELRYGAEKKGSRRLTTQLEAVLGAFTLGAGGPTDRRQRLTDRCAGSRSRPHHRNRQRTRIWSDRRTPSEELAARNLVVSGTRRLRQLEEAPVQLSSALRARSCRGRGRFR